MTRDLKKSVGGTSIAVTNLCATIPYSLFPYYLVVEVTSLREDGAVAPLNYNGFTQPLRVYPITMLEALRTERDMLGDSMIDELAAAREKHLKRLHQTQPDAFNHAARTEVTLRELAQRWANEEENHD